MIQRIQTIYLSLVVILFAVFTYVNEHSLRFLSETNLINVSTSILASLAIVTSLVTIFIYKNRPLQIKLISLSLVLILIAVGLYIYVDGPSVFFLDWPFYLLPVGFVLQYLAKRGVKADEELVRSADRLR